MIKSLITYVSLLILSIKIKNFSSMAKECGKSGNTVARMIGKEKDLSAFLHKKIGSFFTKNEKVTLIIDDTLIDKKHAKSIEGTSFFYNTSLRSEHRAYKISACVLTNGEKVLPIEVDFLTDSRLINPEDKDNAKEKIKQNKLLNKEKRLEFITETILFVTQYIPKERLTVAVDGWFMTVDLLTWAIQNKIKVEGRARSNSTVEYQGEKIALRDIKGVRPKGRQMCRTIKVVWHNLTLFVTIVKRIDRHGNYTIVYQFATYRAKKPIDHVNQYKKRWRIEMFFRTCKQYLGLKDCQSTDFEIQKRHLLSVFCAYTVAQEWAIAHRLPNVETAIRSIQAHKNELCTPSINRFNRIFNHILS